MRYSVKEILGIVQGRLICGDEDVCFRGVSIDSRTIVKGDLYVAIKGKNQNGHAYVCQAFRRGAVGAIVSQHVDIKKNAPIIYVKDTTLALGQIASFHRSHFSLPVIAITGSAGKTTTKEFLSRVLGSKYKVLSNERSFNNQYGVPLTLLKLNSSYQMVVVEIGTNSPGEIASLAEIAQPNIALFTNVGASHLEKLKTPGKVFREKIQLIKNFNKDDIVIFNADDVYLKKIKDVRTEAKKISYGILEKAKVRAKDIIIKKDKTIAFCVDKKKYHVKSIAMHNVSNALAAISCSRLFKIGYNNTNINLKKNIIASGRLQVIKIKGITIIDDTYNSNPLSFLSAIKTLEALDVEGRKICVCGDMLELGEKSKRYHQEIGQVLRKSSFKSVLGLGIFTKFLISKVRSNRNINAVHFLSYEDLNSFLLEYIQKGDVLLVKGSRGMKMEKITEFLKKKL